MIKLTDWRLSMHSSYLYLPEDKRPISVTGTMASGKFQGDEITTLKIVELADVIDGFPVVITYSGSFYHLCPVDNDLCDESGVMAVSLMKAVVKVNQSL